MAQELHEQKAIDQSVLNIYDQGPCRKGISKIDPISTAKQEIQGKIYVDDPYQDGYIHILKPIRY